MTATGPIAWRARTEIPATWDALAQASTFGDLSLQIKLDYIKYSLFGSVIDQADELTLYNPVVLAYAGKVLALEIIPGGMDYWNDQAITFSGAARQSSETVSYPDRIKNLTTIYARLVAEIDKLTPLVTQGPDAIVQASKVMLMPQSSAGGNYVTPEPLDYPRWSEPTTYDPYPFRN